MEHESTGPIDDEALDTIERLARTHQLVARVYVDVDGGGRRELRVDFDLNHYPEAVTKASLQIRWHTNDDYTFHYRDERATGEAWQCRWDRHPHTHNAAREHFHEPPAATDEPISDPVSTVEPYHLFARTMANVNERIQQIWDIQPS
jgi:hypothetical protein